jgi:hypothetical protein
VVQNKFLLSLFPIFTHISYGYCYVSCWSEDLTKIVRDFGGETRKISVICIEWLGTGWPDLNIKEVWLP